MCKCRSHGTFPLFGLQSSHLNICYYHQDLHRRPLRPGSRPGFYGDRRALLHIGAWPLPRRPGIGHALKRHPFSGLVDSAGMLSLEPFSEDQGRSAVHPRGIPPISFLAPYGFPNPLTRTHVRLLGPCFKTGRMGSPQADARSTLVSKHAETARAGFHDRGDDVSKGVSKARAWAATTIRVGAHPEPIGGPSLASFSSFPRGTCSLSVSRPYLALDGIYRPIRAAFPNNPTRRQRLVVRQGPGTTGLSPSPAPLSRGLGPGPPLRTLLQTTIGTPRATDSQAGLFPVHSPLLRESFGHVSAAHAPRTEVQQQTATFSFRFLGVIHAGGCSFCHGETGSRVTGTRRGRGAMKRPHPLPLMFDNTFTGRSARQVQWTSRDVAGNEPPTSPRSEHFTGPFNRAGGTTRPIKARSASPAVGTSRPVLTVRRTGRPTPMSNYELFNCNNLNIRYWSWNYCGCWHQTCPPMDPR
ncbi:hypothetical protein V6N13_116918 [Hibiscus sabdariffa]